MQKSTFILMNNLVGKGLDRKTAYAAAREFLSNHSFSLIRIFVKKLNEFQRRVVATEGNYFASPKLLKSGARNFLFENVSKIIAQNFSDQLKQEIKSVVISSSEYKIVL